MRLPARSGRGPSSSYGVRKLGTSKIIGLLQYVLAVARSIAVSSSSRFLVHKVWASALASPHPRLQLGTVAAVDHNPVPPNLLPPRTKDHHTGNPFNSSSGLSGGAYALFCAIHEYRDPHSLHEWYLPATLSTLRRPSTFRLLRACHRGWAFVQHSI